MVSRQSHRARLVAQRAGHPNRDPPAPAQRAGCYQLRHAPTRTPVGPGAGVAKGSIPARFLGLGAEAQERAIEDAIVHHITRFLLELGAGFAFVGRQVHLEVGGEDFFIDLLFYHLKLRCFVVIELKAGDFKPEYAGKLNFYLSAVDAQMKTAQDGPTIGLLLCKSKNKVVAEYALRDLSKPIGVAEYQLVAALPAELQSSLPSIEAIEQALADEAMEQDTP